MKQKIALKGKQKLRKQINGKFNNTGSADKKKYQQQFPPLSEAEIQGLLHPAQASLGYFLSAAPFPCAASYGNDFSF
jgi:hypothetical protein